MYLLVKSRKSTYEIFGWDCLTKPLCNSEPVSLDLR